MADNDNNELSEQPEEEYEESPTGFDELLYAIAETLRSKRSKEAVAALIERYSAEIPVANKRRHQAMLWSYGFTLLVLAAVGVLGWMKVITNEIAGRFWAQLSGQFSTGGAPKADAPAVFLAGVQRGAATLPLSAAMAECYTPD